MVTSNLMDKHEIIQLRYALNLSQQVFATRLGVGITTVSRWENGKAKPSPLAMERLQGMKGDALEVVKRATQPKLTARPGHWERA